MNTPAHKKTILIIEDDTLLRQFYQEFLVDKEFNIEIAENGEIGIEKIRSLKPDLVLLDLIMPKMSGFEVLDLAKKDDTTKDIPIIIMTNIFSDTEELIKKGAAGCLMKSDVTPDRILAKINFFLSQHV